MANIYDLSDTWNAGATVFTAIKMNVTDTASAAGSLLMDLQVGGVSQFSVSKSGELKKGSVTLLSYGVVDAFTVEVPNSAFRAGGAVQKICVTNDGVLLNTLGFSASSTPNRTTTPDLILTRDAANTFAQRNGVNAQAFNLYNTYTDASNYERGMMRWNANVLEIGTQAAGTGTLRTVALRGDIINIGKASQSAYDISFVPAGSNTLNISQPGGGAPLQQIFAGGIKQRFNYQFGWCVGNDASVSADTGVARNAAGVVKITDGSTGTGQLIFIVPTTDPGITGALWNNTGVLSISA